MLILFIRADSHINCVMIRTAIIHVNEAWDGMPEAAGTSWILAGLRFGGLYR